MVNGDENDVEKLMIQWLMMMKMDKTDGKLTWKLCKSPVLLGKSWLSHGIPVVNGDIQWLMMIKLMVEKMMIQWLIVIKLTWQSLTWLGYKSQQFY